MKGCPGNRGYGPALWKACEKFGRYIAVGAEAGVVDIPMPFSGVVDKPAFETLKQEIYKLMIINSKVC